MTVANQLAADPPAAGHNRIQVLRGISQAEFLGWLDEVRGLDEQVAAAVDRRKAFLADIKQRLGKDEFASFTSVRKDAEMPGESRERRELSRRQMMQWLNKPLGHQASFDMESDDRTVVAINEHELHRVDFEGRDAGKGGRRRDSNPYTPGTELAARWDQGWLQGQGEIAASMAPSGTDNGDQPRRRGRPRKAPSAGEQVH